MADKQVHQAVSGFVGSGRFPIVEYLRGLAALSVTWFHLTNSYADGWVKVSGSLGWLGVEVFFVISGFVIPLSISKLSQSFTYRDFPVFMIRRLARLEPPYLVSLVLTLALWHLSALAPGFKGAEPNYSFAQLAAHLFYLVPLTEFDWLQPVYWSLAWEFAFYITMGLTFPLVGSANNQPAWYFLGCLVLVAVAIGWVPERALLFVIGICLFRGMRSRPSPPKIGDTVMAVAAVIVIGTTNISIASVGAATAVAIFMLRDKTLPARMHIVLAGLGAISYSLYLTHVPIGGRVVNLGRRLVDDHTGELILSAIAVGISLIFSVFFWRFIESPCVALSKSVAR